MDKHDFEVNVQIPVVLSEQDIDDIMVSALEGGINYWCWKAEVVGDYLGDYASEQISRGGSLKLYDMESGEKLWLNREKFLNGFKLWFESNGDRYGAIDGHEVDPSRIDGEMADEIIQFAVFDDVIYC